jgi:hypothetical protein
MRTLRIATAFIAGIWLYYAAVVFTGGILAAVGVPRGYFAFFGREHNELALAVLFFLGWALPIAVLVAGGTLALSRLLADSGQSVWKPALTGMLLSFLYWALASAGFFSPHEQPQIGLVKALLVTFTIPWWATANFLAPWFGFALAVWLMFRAKRSQSPSGA